MRNALGLALIDQRGEAGTSTPVPLGQRAFGGFSLTDNPAAVDISSFASSSVNGVTSVTLFAGITLEGGFLMWFVPDTFVLQQIFSPEVPLINFISGFTLTSTVRQIGGVDFSSYVTGPNNGGLSITQTLSTLAP